MMSERNNGTVLESAAQITRAQCERIVAKKYPNGQYTVLDYQLTSVHEKTGFLGEHCRLVITVRRAANGGDNTLVHCFAKYMPAQVTQHAFVVSTGAFEKETFFYKVLLPKIYGAGIDYLQSCVAECYAIQPGYVMVFDDVTQRGFQPLSKYEHLDYDHVTVVLKSMARLHASSLILEHRVSERLAEPYRIIEQYPEHFYETFFLDEPQHKGGEGVYAAMRGLQTEVDLFPVAQSTVSDLEFKRWIQVQGCRDNFELVKPSVQYRNVLCHGDLWCTNVLIRYQADGRPEHCVFVDFQTFRYCPPSHDFMTFLYLTTTRDFRLHHMHDLQRLYYGELHELLHQHGVHLPAVIPYEEFRASCEQQKRVAVILAATYATLTQIKNEFMTEFARDEEKWNRALYVDRSEMILENYKRDPEYGHALRETMKDLRAVCEEQFGQN